MPKILRETPNSWHDEQNAKLAKAADMFFEGIMKAPGLIPIMPDGAMYMMVKTPSKLNIKYSMHFLRFGLIFNGFRTFPMICHSFKNWSPKNLFFACLAVVLVFQILFASC